MNKSKKVVLVYPSLGPYHIARLRHLYSNFGGDDDVDFCFLSIAESQRDYPWFSAQEAIDEQHFETLYPNRGLEEISTTRAIIALSRFIVHRKPDLVFLYSYSDPRSVFVAIVTVLMGGKAVIMSDSTYLDFPRSKLKEWFKSVALSLFSGAFVSGVRAEKYIRSLGFIERRIVQGVNVVDNSSIRDFLSNKLKTEDARNEKYFISVARMIEKKNIEGLIVSFSNFVNENPSYADFRLLLCGDGPLREDLQQKAIELDNGNIEFCGHVRQPELFEYISNAKALILPSRSEQWGLVVNEALACGTPVLVSDYCGCVPELVIEGLTGWSFDPIDHERLSKLLLKFAKMSPASELEMRENCVRVISDWGLERFSNGVMNFVRPR